jgi:Flp pilus assembly protein TadG
MTLSKTAHSSMRGSIPRTTAHFSGPQACSTGILRWLGGARRRLRCGRRRLAQSPRHGMQRGQTLVEFSLVVSFLFLILFAIIDFSRVFFAYATMANGVREGARYAVVHPDATDTSDVEAAARAMMVVIGGDATVTVVYPDTVNNNVCIRRPCRVVVTATSDFDVWTPVIPSFQIVTRSTMHIE